MTTGGENWVTLDRRRLDKPVVNSNQAVLWSALRRLEIAEPIDGPGRLFHSEPRA